ncbi:hypothetical protein BVX94_00900 [bacterium B17]|nr:hypothetical protein BVX94_00900 [bacterium B17]
MIDFIQVSKGYGAQQVLDNVSFRINSGERVGIVGPNGAGKSTIFELLMGEISEDEGRISVPKGARIGHLHQQLGALQTTDSVLEYAESGLPEIAELQRQIDAVNLKMMESDPSSDERDKLLRQLGDLQTRFEAIDGYSVRNRAEAALSGLGFSEADFGRAYSEFSGGWKMRAELVRVLISDPEILLLDEPSNYLDIPAIEWLKKFLRVFAGTLLLISHDRYLLNSLVDCTLEIANGMANRYHGNYDHYMIERVKRYEQRMSEKKNMDRKREAAERFIERFRAKNTKASAVQSRIKMLERMDEVALPREVVSKGSIRLPAPVRSGEEVISLQDMGVTYDGERWVLRGVDFRLIRGERTALVGMNGLGKTTLLRVLSGALKPSEGKRVLGHKVCPGYQSQDFAETIRDDQTVFNAIRSVGGAASDQNVRSMLGGFGFTGSDVDKNVQVLSGGEKVRLAFARMLIDPPNFLLLDEPTTHLDLAAREALESALCDYQGTLCFVSHDIEFVRNVAENIVAMTPPGITRYPGGYDYYCEKISAGPAINKQAVETGKSKQKANRRERAEVVQKYGKLRKELQREINKIEKRIEGFEAEQQDLVEKLSLDSADYETLNRSLQSVQQKLCDYNMRWEAFAIELDELEQEYAAQRRSGE